MKKNRLINVVALVFSATILSSCDSGNDVVTNVIGGASNQTQAMINYLNLFVPKLTWVSGAKSYNQLGNYGVLGQAGASNMPGSRAAANLWTDESGNIWLFGGNGYASDNYGNLNDLWKYDQKLGQWVWVNGANTTSNNGSYGKKGISSKANVPPARNFAANWKDSAGDFWLFGGSFSYNSTPNSFINDLWKYSPQTNQWTWVSGSDTPRARGTYGTQGIANAANAPGGRYGMAAWTDKAGNVWLMGGNGYDKDGKHGLLNDLWKYNPQTNQWTWVKGSYNDSQNGVYGIRGTAGTENIPGARQSSTTWIDSGGNLWLFGGLGFAAQGKKAVYLNDLWKYDPQTNQWTWVNGSNVGNAVNVYGAPRIASSSNVLGGRSNASGWVDNSGSFWLFGGVDYGSHNDLWKYNPQTNQWTWMGGTSLLNATGKYGSLGVESDSYIPTGRYTTNMVQDSSGYVWLFGGFFAQGPSAPYLLNDLWRINTGDVPVIGLSLSNLSIANSTNSLVDVPVGSLGIKGYTVSNVTVADVNNVTLPTVSTLPTGMTYDLSRTTCKTDGTQLLKAGQSCAVVFKYQPTAKGVSGILSLKVSGVNGYAQSVVSLAQSLNYSSRTDPVFDKFTNVAIGYQWGLKTVKIQNNGANLMYAILFPTRLPTDITVNKTYSTCAVNGTQQLKPGENCVVVLQYLPQLENVVNTLNFTMTAKELVGGTETSVSNSFAIPYSSGLTSSVFNGVVEGNNSSIGLTVNALTGTSYSNNVTNVPVGGFGLYGYTITNSSASNIYALTLPAASSLPSGMTYDSTRATCKITNKQMLKSSESCTMVFKYQPTIKGVSGVFNFKFIAVDDFYNSVVSLSKSLNYSSRY